MSQTDIDTFATLTRDHEWIHVDPARAADGPFGTTIAHGFLTLSLLPGMMAEVLRLELDAATVNYGLDRVRFLRPVPVGSSLRVRCAVESLEARSNGLLVRLQHQIQRSTGDDIEEVCVVHQLLCILR